MRLAYLVNLYPMVSHSFIRREILALERQGFEIFRISLRGWDSELADPEDQLERIKTRYVLRDGIPALLLAITRMLITKPVLLLRAMALAWRVSRRSERPLPIHLVYLAEACRIEPWLRAAGVQHLHAHFGTSSAAVAMLVHALGGPPWSFTVHGNETFDKRLFVGLTEKIRQCAFVVAVCSYGRSQLYRSVEHEHWHKVKVVHCGLEPNFYSMPKSAAPTARLVCIGRLCGEKGQLLLLEATRRLAAHREDFEVVLAGDGEMRGEIEEIIARYKLTDRVHITGWISSEQVRNEILASRALILPSFAEGLPVVIMETMALRRCVISTYVAGIPELVRSGEHGWLVPAGDVDALMQVMSSCLDASADLLAQMGEAAYTRVVERHSIDTEAAKLAALFRATAEKPSRSEPLPAKH